MTDETFVLAAIDSMLNSDYYHTAHGRLSTIRDRLANLAGNLKDELAVRDKAMEKLAELMAPQLCLHHNDLGCNECEYRPSDGTICITARKDAAMKAAREELK